MTVYVTFILENSRIGKERRECSEGLCNQIRTPISMDNACELASKKVVKCDNQNFVSFPVVAQRFTDRTVFISLEI